ARRAGAGGDPAPGDRPARRAKQELIAKEQNPTADHDTSRTDKDDDRADRIGESIECMAENANGEFIAGCRSRGNGLGRDRVRPPGERDQLPPRVWGMDDALVSVSANCPSGRDVLQCVKRAVVRPWIANLEMSNFGGPAAGAAEDLAVHDQSAADPRSDRHVEDW